MENRIENYLRQFREVQEGPNWIDENFRKKLESVSEDQAFTRPGEGIHSVAELVSHLLVWRSEVFRRLQGMERKLKMSSPENWKTNAELKPMEWKNLKNNFYKSQEELAQLLKPQPDSYLEKKYSGDHTYCYLIEGLLHHDLYHLGQLGITIKLLKYNNEPRQ